MLLNYSFSSLPEWKLFYTALCFNGFSKNNTGNTVYSYWSKAFLADFHGMLKVCGFGYICLSFKVWKRFLVSADNGSNPYLLSGGLKSHKQ